MGASEVVVDKSLATIVGDLAERFGGHVATVRPSLSADRWNVDFIHEAGNLAHVGMCRRFEQSTSSPKARVQTRTALLARFWTGS